ILASSSHGMGTIANWDDFFIEKNPYLTLRDSHNRRKIAALFKELKEEERPDLSIRDLHSVVLRLTRWHGVIPNLTSHVLRLTRWHGEEDRPDLSYAATPHPLAWGRRASGLEYRDGKSQKNCLDGEELLIDVGKFPALLDYCQVLEEFQESHVDEVSQSGRHLSKLIREYRDDRFSHIINAIEVLANNGRIGEVVSGYSNSADSNHVGSSLQSNAMSRAREPTHIKSQMWSRIFSDSFILNEVRFEPVCELHHLIPGNGSEGSARSDFAAVVMNEKQGQFPFLIAEFEQQGFEVHKDFAVVVCEAVYELNRILSMTRNLSPAEVLQIKVYVALANDTSINFGIIRPIYNGQETAILYAYDQNVVYYDLRTGNQQNDLKNALDLIVYLREVVCKDGLIIKNFLTGWSAHRNQSILWILPKLPTKAEKSRETDTKYTPKKRRIRYVYQGVGFKCS
ncbi:8696_t:CDS:2, partial [Ambispora gerdemannii]